MGRVVRWQTLEISPGIEVNAFQIHHFLSIKLPASRVDIRPSNSHAHR
jgi:hypothetical protein